MVNNMILALGFFPAFVVGVLGMVASAGQLDELSKWAILKISAFYWVMVTPLALAFSG